ncbi:rho/rac/cdc gtpase-activating protein [Anaeramoeba flamelloides]|uniref:Rho/rac/cdc gtpase-activating protein n=1 Tax=Anaeramoeba flamelloides TaxID=1746091 RepID=A0ABQ8YLA4_9EUKA|nr:rho/rac/cdc gtpase-activating protein [Anaeramoeba flamelloides]
MTNLAQPSPLKQQFNQNNSGTLTRNHSYAMMSMQNKTKLETKKSLPDFSQKQKETKINNQEESSSTNIYNDPILDRESLQIGLDELQNIEVDSFIDFEMKEFVDPTIEPEIKVNKKNENRFQGNEIQKSPNNVTKQNETISKNPNPNENEKINNTNNNTNTSTNLGNNSTTGTTENNKNTNTIKKEIKKENEPNTSETEKPKKKWKKFKKLTKKAKSKSKILRSKAKSKSKHLSHISKQLLNQKKVDNTVFGVSLDLVLQREQRANNQPPRIVEQCIRYLDRGSLKEVGLYRLSGSLLQVNKHKEEYNNGADVKIDEIMDCNVVCSLFKLWFRELPDPIIPSEYHQKLVTLSSKDDYTIIQEVYEILKQLPIQNQTIFQNLLPHLYRVQEYADINKMNANNLAIVFSPTLHIPLKIMSTMIAEYESILPETKQPNTNDESQLESENNQSVKNADESFTGSEYDDFYTGSGTEFDHSDNFSTDESSPKQAETDSPKRLHLTKRTSERSLLSKTNINSKSSKKNTDQNDGLADYIIKIDPEKYKQEKLLVDLNHEFDNLFNKQWNH